MDRIRKVLGSALESAIALHLGLLGQALPKAGIAIRHKAVLYVCRCALLCVCMTLVAHLAVFMYIYMCRG